MNLSSRCTAILIVLALHAAAFGQTVDHDVAVTIPELFGIRIVGPGTGGRSVEFDYASVAGVYSDAVTGSGVLPPTSVNRFADVQVHVTRNGRWSVSVLASPISHTGPGTGGGLVLESISVTRGQRSGLEQDAIIGTGGSAFIADSWVLRAEAQTIAFRRGPTSGWRSLGFNGWDYDLSVDGSEAPGTYSTVVTYILTAP